MNCVFSFYPRIDIISNTVRRSLDKRRWYISQIKSRSDLNQSNKKIYKQKGSGLARHSTKSVFQFRGGGKYCAKKQIRNININKKIKSLAFKSGIILKINNKRFITINKIFEARNLLLTNGLLVHSSTDSSLLLPLLNCGFECVYYTNFNTELILKHNYVIFTKSVLYLLSKLLKPNWQLVVNNSVEP
ncbi:uL4 family ribosomal protein [Candidatus Hodgkinia cicadicola]